eukprot:4619628-Pyramimonas_sp.AAC.1
MSHWSSERRVLGPPDSRRRIMTSTRRTTASTSSQAAAVVAGPARASYADWERWAEEPSTRRATRTGSAGQLSNGTTAPHAQKALLWTERDGQLPRRGQRREDETH